MYLQHLHQVSIVQPAMHAIYHSTLHWLSWWGPRFVGEVTLSLVPTREHGHIRACSTNCNFSKLTKLGTDQMD